MRPVVLGLVGLLACRSIPEQGEPPAAPPNILLINADDLGFGDLGCYGATHLSTPNLDRLAREGRRFTDAHSASAVCSPSRYGLLTGRYPIRRNFWGPASSEQELVIDTRNLTLASLLSQRGYQTACLGKWHLGFGAGAPEGGTIWNGALVPGPLEVGFDHYAGLPCVNSGPPFVWVEDHHVLELDLADPIVPGERSVTEVWPAKGGYDRYGGAQAAHLRYRDQFFGTELAQRGVDWLRGVDRARPFFLYFATTQIHHPFTPAPRFEGTSDCGRYGDFVHELDWMVGELLDALDELGLAESTLVVFTSDNGGMLNHGGQEAWSAGHRLNGDLLGFKFGAWEGGHRVPMLARWPGVVPAGSECADLVSQVDLLATFAGWSGGGLPEGQGLDSVDVSRCFTTAARELEDPPRRELIVSPNSPRHLLLRQDDWVYIPARGEGGFRGKRPGAHTFGGPPVLAFTGQHNSDVADGVLRAEAPSAQLYDLRTDPQQQHNVIEEHPEVAARLAARLEVVRGWTGDGPRIGWIDPGNR